MRERAQESTWVNEVLVWLARALCAGLLWAYAANASLPGVGAFQDDAVYLSTARSLAEGRGYTIDILPEPVPQTKYPPAMTWALAGLWKLDGRFPENVRLMKGFVMAATAGWMAAVFLLARRMGVGRTGAWWVVCLTAMHPWALFTGTNVLSDVPFALLAALTLVAMTCVLEEGRSRWWTAGLAAAGAMAYLMRTVGAGLWVAVFVVLVWRRMWRQAWACGLVWGATAGGWALWQSAAGGAADGALRYLSGEIYRQWWAFALPAEEGIRVALRNALMAAGALAQPVTLDPALGPLVLLAGGLVWLAAARGAAREWRGKGAAAGVWAAVSAAVCVGWTWPPARLLLPCFPVLLILFLRDVGPVRGRVNTALAAALLCGYVAGAGREILNSLRVGRECGVAAIYRQRLGRWDAMVRTAEWLKANTPEGAVIGSNNAGVYALLSGRKGVWPHAPEPLALFYGGQPRDREDDEELAAAVRRYGIGYLLPTEADGGTDQGRLMRAVGRWQAKRPECVRAVYEDPAPGYKVYQVLCAP